LPPFFRPLGVNVYFVLEVKISSLSSLSDTRLDNGVFCPGSWYRIFAGDICAAGDEEL
jgi:hypothetical protein